MIFLSTHKHNMLYYLSQLIKSSKIQKAFIWKRSKMKFSHELTSQFKNHQVSKNSFAKRKKKRFKVRERWMLHYYARCRNHNNNYKRNELVWILKYKHINNFNLFLRKIIFCASIKFFEQKTLKQIISHFIL